MMRWHSVHAPRRQHRTTHAALRAALVAALQCVFCGCGTGRSALVVNRGPLINVCKREREREGEYSVSFQLSAANQLQQKSERVSENHTSFPRLALLNPLERACLCLSAHARICTVRAQSVRLVVESTLLYFAYHHLAQISFV